MSSLRLALKQSLAESGQMAAQQQKDKERRKRDQIKQRKRRERQVAAVVADGSGSGSGSPSSSGRPKKRGRGRPRKERSPGGTLFSKSSSDDDDDDSQDHGRGSGGDEDDASTSSSGKNASNLFQSVTLPATMTNKLYCYRESGRSNQIRLALAAAGIVWEDVTPDVFPPTKEDRNGWRQIGGNTTTNVPMLVLDGKAYTQSIAVLMVVARKGGLMPTNESDLYLVDKITADAEDLRTLANGTFVSWGAPQKKADDFIQTGLPLHLGNFERQLTGDFFIGSALTVADIAAYDAIVSFGSNRVPGALDQFPKLKAWAKRFEDNPKIANYQKSSQYEDFGQFDIITKSV